MKLTQIAVDNPVFATMMMVALLVMGLFSYRQLGVDQFPNVDFPIVVVTTEYPGASPETVETEISRKIEESVNAIAGLKTLTSRSLEGRSIVVAEFELSVQSSIAMQDVREKVQQVRAAFKPEIKEPLIQRFNPDDQPIVSIAVRSDIRSVRDLTTLADQLIVKRLQTVRDVGRATIAGGVKRQINIELDPGRMHSLRVGVNDIMRAIRDENQNFPAGNVARGNDDRIIEVTGRVAEPGNFADLIVARRGLAPVYLRQVATVVDGQQELESVATQNGERALAIDVVKTQGSNTIEVARGVRRAVADLQAVVPPDVKLEIVRDSSRGIQNSVSNVQQTMIEGGLLTIAIVFLFLHSWRSTVITGLALPISVFGAFMVMAAFGFTLNVLTLMALSLAIGILIDDAIVVRENIMRHIGFGKTHRQAAIDGTNEIGLAVLATTFCIVAVFLPVAFMGGIIGRFFFQFGVMVSAAVLISLFVSFTLDPMLSSIWYDPQAHGTGRFARIVNATQDRANNLYRAILGWSLRWPKITLLIALGTFVGSFALPKYIGFEFVPQADLGEQVVSIETPIGSSLEYTTAKLNQVDAAVREIPEVAYTYGTVNTGYANGKNQASLYLRLKPIKERKRSPEQLAQPIRERLAGIPGVLVSINIPGGPGGGVQKQLQLSLQGPDTAVLDTLSQEVMRRAAAIPGIVDLDRNLKAAKPVLSVRLRRDAASDLGLGSVQVAQSLRPLFAGDETSLWRAPDGENYTVMVRLPVDERTGVADLQRIWFTAGFEPTGLPRMVHIAQIADIIDDVGASQINRRDLNREVQITANVSGRSTGEASSDLQKILAETKLPPGYRFVFGGSTKDMAESAAYAGQALLLAVILIYLILASQFGSFLQPIAIMMSLPMSLIGVFLGLLIAGTTLNIFSAIGFIMLMGLVTKNAILLVDFFNQSRARGTPVNEALLEAGMIRLRPILMTTLAMVFGMMPLALGLGEGASQRAPMAHAVIGGLISSTLLTLVVVPVMLIYIDRIGAWTKKRFSRSADDVARRHKPAE
ncbi:MAG: efflux RND transporter permease subunit [Reyranella sp.]|uniref:efflux RND transporter permease subunit n=1 Tax=Reyranella sp. TaxID=1929291 RepID=UPI0011FDACA6|nr:efflux RND transporter permease subunit [Reyranella sp.]TAJ37163.1 MAG: efflux RND transporter permease subunit [Reyranella sp.]